MALLQNKSFRSVRNWYAPSLALMLWFCLWCNLNTGFWNFSTPQSAGQWRDLVRAALPFFVLPIAAMDLLRKRNLRFPKRSPSRLLFAYGAFSTFATVFSPQPGW